MMLNNQMRHITKNRLIYDVFVFLLTLLEFLSIYSNAHSGNLMIYTAITAGIMGVLGMFYFFTSGINLRKILFLIILFIIYWSSSFNNFWMVPICISVAFANFDLYDLIDAYYVSNIITLTITVFLAIIGLSPMRNQSDGVLTLGFATENALGLVLALISFVFVLEIIKFKNRTRYYLLKVAFIILTIIMNMMVLGDRTMGWSFLLFLGLILIFKWNKKIIIYLMKILGIIIPYVLTYVSWILTTNYGNSNWLYELDKFLSYRLVMWNWYYQRAPLSLLPNTFRLSSFNYWGTIDGSYILLLLQYGIMMTLLMCTMLAISNFLLLKYRYFDIFCIMISLEFAAFMENILQFYTMTIPLVLALLMLYKGWLRKSKNEDNSLENTSLNDKITKEYV